jgi:hypothetical protein
MATTVPKQPLLSARAQAKLPQQPAGEPPLGSPAPPRQLPGAVAPWWTRPQALPSPEDEPRLARQAASRQWPGAAPEARSQSAAPDAAAA